jgi:hypothetical protein
MQALAVPSSHLRRSLYLLDVYACNKDFYTELPAHGRDLNPAPLTLNPRRSRVTGPSIPFRGPLLIPWEQTGKSRLGLPISAHLPPKPVRPTSVFPRYIFGCGLHSATAWCPGARELTPSAGLSSHGWLHDTRTRPS